MKQGNMNEQQAMPPPQRRRSSLPISILAVLFVSATFLTWYYTWFGRDLSDQEITSYLKDEKHPRHVQHALLQIQQRLEKSGGNCCGQWLVTLQELTGHPEPEFRMTVAWLMGYDNKSASFHQSLLKLLRDTEPMVRRNAALALVRFSDASGHDDLLTVLGTLPLSAPVAGVVNSTLGEGASISRGTLLARIQMPTGEVLEVRSPLPGRIEKIAAGNGTAVDSGATILTLTSDANSVWEALRGLALIGQPGDLSEIDRYAQGVSGFPEGIKKQAALTAKSIQSRTAQQGQNGQEAENKSLTQ